MSGGGKTQLVVNTTTPGSADSVAAYLASRTGVFLDQSTVTPKIHAAFTFAPGDVNTTNDTITKTNHQLETGDKLQFSTSGALPTGLSASTDYWVIRVDANTFKVASSAANAEAGTAIDITAAGTGTHTATEQEQGVKVLNARLAGLEKIEDEAHVSGDRGIMPLAVRSDAGGTLVGTDGDYAPLQVDSSGRLRVVADLTVSFDSTYAEDAAHTTADIGTYVLGVRNDAFAAQTSTDGDYGSINLDSAGRVGIRGSYAEDAAHTSGDAGVFTLAVRSDAGGSLVGTDGDYAPFQVDSAGRLRVVADLTAAFDFVYAEDIAHTTGDLGAFMLGVRNDANAALTSTDGDYSPLATDSAGRLKVVMAGQFAEDTAHTDADTGLFMLGVRQDTNAATAGASGDYSALQTWSNGELKVVDVVNQSNLQQIVTVGTSAVALPTTALTNRKLMFVQNLSNQDLYVGSSTVANSGANRGFLLGKGGFVTLEAGPSNAIYGISSAAGCEVVVWEHR